MHFGGMYFIQAVYFSSLHVRSSGNFALFIYCLLVQTITMFKKCVPRLLLPQKEYMYDTLNAAMQKNRLHHYHTLSDVHKSCDYSVVQRSDAVFGS